MVGDLSSNRDPARLPQAMRDNDCMAELDSSQVRGVAPIGYRLHLDPAYDPSHDHWLTEASVLVEPMIDPRFCEVMERLGLQHSSEAVWTMPLDDAAPDVLMSLLECVDGSIFHLAARRADRRSWRDGPRERAQPLIDALCSHPALAQLEQQRLAALLMHTIRSTRGPAAHSNLQLEIANDLLRIQAFTHPLARDAGLTEDPLDLDMWQASGRRPPLRLYVDEAMRLVAALREDAWESIGVHVSDEIGLTDVAARLDKALLVYQDADAPGRGRLVVGPGVRKLPGVSLAGRETGQFHTVSISALQADDLVRRAKGLGRLALMDAHVRDVAAMATATACEEPLLRPYQQEAVGVHLATQVGYLNACAVGLGKTVITAVAWQRRIEQLDEQEHSGWRAIVVCPSTLRSQWIRELARFCPAAQAVTLESSGFAQRLQQFEREHGAKPQILVVSYHCLVTCLQHVARRSWSEAVADEPKTLRNTRAKRTRALWRLRDASVVGIALTGTPIERDLDDLGWTVAWTRGNRDLMQGRRRLSRAYDLRLAGEAERMHRDLGPLVFRRDQSEIADELQAVTSEVVILDPTVQELALATAARTGLAEAVAQLDERFARMESDPADRDLARAARRELASLRMSAISGITLARKAASDPEAVAQSASTARHVLDGMGLLQPALEHGGTKRKLVAGMLEDLSSRGEAVLVFTEFNVCARNLVRELRERDVRASTLTSDMSHRAFDAAMLAFQSGELDVLVLGPIAREGLNLQRATVAVNYDLPWVPAWIVQRLGRARRIGASSKRLLLLTVIMAGTIEEQVAALVLSRAAVALAALDLPRKVALGDTELGIAVEALAEADLTGSGQDIELQYARMVLASST
jgi:superfamily II DNA or RNA helicase